MGGQALKPSIRVGKGSNAVLLVLVLGVVVVLGVGVVLVVVLAVVLVLAVALVGTV